jgi:predicted aldo/keto reductase-like oxidoreductase
MYFEDFGAQKTAMQLYAALDTQADVCAGCSAPCAQACPHGIAIPERTRETHELLRLS